MGSAAFGIFWTRNLTRVPCVDWWILNHWGAKTSTNTFSLHNNPVRQACKDVSHFKDKDREVRWVNEVPGEPVRCKAGPGHTAAESGPPGCLWSKSGEWGPICVSPQPPCVLDLSTHIHIHVHTASTAIFTSSKSLLYEKREKGGQTTDVVSGRWARMSGQKLKAWEAHRAEGGHPRPPWVSSGVCWHQI